MNTVTIVGAGPAGLGTAIELKERGWDSLILEEHPQVGIPTHCTGLISSSGAKELGLKLKDSLVNNIYGAELISPAGNRLTVKKKGPVAFVIDRAFFDKSLQKRAVKLGLKVQFNSQLIDLRKETLFFKKKKHGEMDKTKILIGADGVHSKARELMELSAPKENLIHTYQEFAEGSFDEKMAQMHFGSFAPGFFAWVVPESNCRARIGIGTTMDTNPVEAFKKFKEEKGLEFSAIKRESFIVPVGPPLKSSVNDNILLVGDAAFQTKATTGGGIILGMLSAQKCAAAVDHFLKNGKPLSNYNSYLKEVNRELKIHWKIRSYINGLEDKKIDSLFEKMKRAGVEEFLQEHGDMDKPSKFVGKILKKPGMWSLAGLAMKFR